MSTIATGPPAWRETEMDFSHSRQSFASTGLVQASRERVIPTEWQARTILGDCNSRTKLIPAQAPLYQQSALVSGFLDFANLST